jgi:hypothetical protein
MSIHLLRNPITHHYDIEDDRESALYLMLWTALRYTKHSDVGDLLGSTANDLLEAFNEARPNGSGSFNGGISKFCFLAMRSKLRFDDRPQLNALIMRLRRTFSARYQEEPDPQDLPFLLTCYNADLENLKTKNWLVSAIQEYLTQDGWPIGDKAEPQKK